MTSTEIKAKIAAFDFSTLSFYRGENPVFFNFRTGEIDTYAPGTDPEIAAQQNSVIWIGDLSEESAKKGLKPEGGILEDRLELILGEKY